MKYAAQGMDRRRVGESTSLARWARRSLTNLLLARAATFAALLLGLTIGSRPADAQTVELGGPGFSTPIVKPVIVTATTPAPEKPAKLTDLGGQNVGLQLPPPTPAKGAPFTLANAKVATNLAGPPVPAALIPSSVAELARALKYDPVLIYEFVRNNIEYLPVAAAIKGSEGTLADGIGTDYDIAQLMIDLINADPNHVATATAVRGKIELTPTDAASWIGLNGMNACSLASTLGAGFDPNDTGAVTIDNANCSSVTKVQIKHVWVKVKIGANTYEIDPSFKAHTVVAPINLATATGYARSQYLANACSSCNTNANIVTSINRPAVLDPANAQGLPKLTRNLLAYLQTNNLHDLSKVIGGHQIVQAYSTSLPVTPPYTIIDRYADPMVIDGTARAALLININGISKLYSSDAIYGKRLTVTFNASNYPQLNLDGVIQATGTTPAAAGTKLNVVLSICMPTSGANCTDSRVDSVTGKALWCPGSGSPSYNLCFASSLVSGGIYAISNVWGPIGHNTVLKHQRASAKASNDGLAATAEGNLGEVLTTLGLSWVEQTNLYNNLALDGKRNGGYFYYNVGIAGHAGTNGGPYVDLPGNKYFPGVSETLNPDGSYTPAGLTTNLLDGAMHSSILESTSVRQSTGITAMSTAKIFDIAISQLTSIYDFKTCADYTTYNASLVGYSAADKSAIQTAVCSNSTRVVLPGKGNLTDPLITATPKWTGAGYYLLTPTNVAAKISGDYAGGFASAIYTPVQTTNYAGFNYGGGLLGVSRSAFSVLPLSSSSSLSSWNVSSITSPFDRVIADPIDHASGAFLLNGVDISIGENDPARVVALERSYTTADTSPKNAFGQGWRSSLEYTAQAISDGVRPTGAYDAWDAAELIAEKYVSQDLLSDPNLPVLNIAVASIGHRWIGDRLVDNLVSVNAGTSAMSFQRLADDSYNPSRGSTARLGGTASARTVTGPDGAVMTFGAPDANSLARVDKITQPTGAVTNFTYTSGNLTKVSNNFGRTLNLNWTGTHITSVTDTPLLAAAARTVTYTYSGDLLQMVTDVRSGRTLYCYDAAKRMTSYYLPTQGGGSNCAAAGANISNTYDTLDRVSQQVDGASHVTDLYLAGTRAEWVTHPAGGVADVRSIRYLDNFGNTIRDISPRTGLATTNIYDALGRLVRMQYPEGNAIETSYDLRSNPVQTCVIPKTAAAYPACDTSANSQHIWTRVAYNEGATIWSCVTIATCNKPSSTTDALGNVTSYTYNSDGTVASITSPLPSGATGAPKTAFEYTSTAATTGSINLLTKMTVTSTATTTPAIATTFGYDTAANGLVLKTQTLDATGLNYVTTFGYDGYGNRKTVDGPRTDVTDVTTTDFDLARNPIKVTGADAGNGSPVTQTTYNGDGRITSVAQKLGASNWMVACKTYTPSGQTLTTFGPYKTTSPTDCTFAANANVPLTTYTYDGADRLYRTTVSEPSDDRTTQLSLLPDGQVGSATRGFGTAAASTETNSYSDNGLPLTATDGNGNKTTLQYDGFDRAQLMQYPTASNGAISSATDVVGYAYDKRGLVLRRSIRGNADVSASCVQCIRFDYDELGRLKQKTVSATLAIAAQNIPSVPGYAAYYGYDLIGRASSQGFSAGAPELTYSYDNAGRLTQSVQYGRTVAYSYGLVSQGIWRRMDWPGGGGMMLTCYDALGRVKQIKEAVDCTTATGQLASYAYDDLSRRTGVTRGNGTGATYAYADGAGLDTGVLRTLFDNPAGQSFTTTLTYNRVGQIATRGLNNDAYVWRGAYNVVRPYTSNGLDQYAASGSVALSYDARGNISSGGGQGWAYDNENRLVQVLGWQSATLGYDPLGRLQAVVPGTGPLTERRWLYDGDALIAEYDGNGSQVVRHVPGPSTDETLLTYGGTGNADKRYLHSDERGSIVAATNASAAVLATNAYDDYGIPGAANAGRFQYTGQVWLAEIGLYHYKARTYSPTLGRFLQTDPIGAQDDRNLYAYVANDPLNRTDPTGLECNKERTSCSADNALNSRAQDVRHNSQADSAVVASSKQFKSATAKGGEPTGTVTGSTVTSTASKAGSTSTGDTAKFSLGKADAGVHGHLGGTVTDDPPSNGGYGDTQSLKQGKPMYTVEGNRVGVHDSPGGVMRFEMVKGKMTSGETTTIQQNLNEAQKRFNRSGPPE